MIRYLTLFIFIITSSNSYASGISGSTNKFACTKYQQSEDFTESCYISIQVQVSEQTDCEKIACFGEVNFKQVYKGEVKEMEAGFLVSATQVDFRRWPASFELREFIYFPLSYEALNPTLGWLNCQVVVP